MGTRLPDSISSVQDLTTLVLELRTYAKWFRQEAIKKQVGAKRSADAGPDLSQAAAELIRTLDKNHDNKALDQLIETLEDYKTKAPTLAITLAAPPPTSLKHTLVGWCRENVSPSAMVTFRFNSTLLGGMTVQCGSRVFDWSFRRQLLAAKDNFPEVLRRV